MGVIRGWLPEGSFTKHEWWRGGHRVAPNMTKHITYLTVTNEGDGLWALWPTFLRSTFHNGCGLSAIYDRLHFHFNTGNPTVKILLLLIMVPNV